MRLFGRQLMSIWLVVVIVITLATLLLYHHLLVGSLFRRRIRWNGTRLPHDDDNSSWRGYLVSSPTCSILDIDPFDPTVAGLYQATGQLDCGWKKPPLVGVSFPERILWLEGGVAFEHYGESPDRVHCRVSVIERDKDGRSDNEVTVKNGGLVLTSSPSLIDHEFVQVYCDNSAGSYLYSDYFAFVIKKDEVEERVRRPPLPVADRKRALGAVLLGIDSVSRLNFLRHFPLTLDFLTSGPLASRVVQLTGYTKVGGNTLPNMLPMLAGVSEEEVNTRHGAIGPHTHFDHLDFMWKRFAARGIRTLFAEDSPDIATFNYMKGGFRQQPTDYYYRPLTLVSEDSRMRAEATTPHCFNNRTEIGVLLQWLHDFLSTFSTDPLFALAMSSRLTHDLLNHAGYVDRPLVDFLQTVIAEQLLDRSVLFLFSDHGIRFGPIRQTHVGWMEERLPFMFIVVPTWFPAEYPTWWRALQRNQRRLSTPFDVHATLRDILQLSGQVSMPPERGRSLLTELSDSRSCDEAGIAPHWCVCQRRRPIGIDDERVIGAAGHLMTTIETLLAEVRNVCAPLVLTQLLSAHLSFLDESSAPGGSVTPTSGIVDYLLTIVVSPGGASFEATVRYWWDTDVYETMGHVSRINRYGNQSWCVNSYQLRLYCFCTVQSGGDGGDAYNITDS